MILKTIEIDIPEKTHRRGIKIATEAGVTIGEVYTLGILHRLPYSYAELEENAVSMRDDGWNE